MKGFITKISNLAFFVGCICLYVVAIWIYIWAIYGVIHDAFQPDFTIYKLLDEVALIVFAIAVTDVAKYLMFEEVLREGERTPREELHTFTKFVTIIVTALLLEALVLMIQTAKWGMRDMIYPVFLFLTAAALIIALGIYQRLNNSSNKDKI